MLIRNNQTATDVFGRLFTPYNRHGVTFQFTFPVYFVQIAYHFVYQHPAEYIDGKIADSGVNGRDGRVGLFPVHRSYGAVKSDYLFAHHIITLRLSNMATIKGISAMEAATIKLPIIRVRL